MSGSTTWDVAPPPPAAPPLDTSPVRLVIIAQPSSTQMLNAAFAADARFAVLALATSMADAKPKLVTNPEVVLVEAVAAAGPTELANVFSSYRGQVWVLTPQGLGQESVEAVRRIECVAQVVEGQPNFAVLAGQIYASVLQRRIAAPAAGESFVSSRSTTTTVGFRTIAVWSTQGGVGKSTIALALALEAKARNLPVLLLGLAAPDMTPLVLKDVANTPNLASWQSNPTVEGLKAAIQIHKRTGLHILPGFRDTVALGDYNAQTGPAALQNLVFTATRIGYSIIILDVSAPEVAPAALSIANTLVLVARPDLPGVLSALEGLRMVKDVLAGQHAIPAEAVYLVVNRVRNTTMTPDEIVREGKASRRDFPPLAAAIMDDPNVELAVKAMQPARDGSEPLRLAAKTLGNLLFPAAMQAAPDAGQAARVKRFGPFVFRER
ncbi:MAG: ParA family protein [Chloroflexi bacterium]|nr:ParA family protein [Chloroflexota bacterium]